MENKESKAKKEDTNKKSLECLTYKRKPLLRCGDTLFYGNMSDKYVVKMDIKEKKTDEKGYENATKVFVQLLSTDATLSIKDQIVKTAYRESLFKAMDLGYTWLKRKTEDKKKEQNKDGKAEKKEKATTKKKENK